MTNNDHTKLQHERKERLSVTDLSATLLSVASKLPAVGRGVLHLHLTETTMRMLDIVMSENRNN
jgi:hypothetical protein